MSLLSWMFPAKKGASKQPNLPESSGLSRMDPTRPVRRGERDIPVANAQPANRKHERMARRELLYGIVRETMMRTGVLTSSYKFKVLSLDGRGRQFLVMIDLSRDSGVAVTQLGEIEAMIAQAAKTRFDILVTAVYWRMSEHVAVGDPKRQPARAEPHAADVPAVLESGPMPLEPKPVTRSRFEPIGADEVAAFKRAIAAGVDNPAATAAAAAGVAHGAKAVGFDGVEHHGPQSYTLLTGFEDTEVAEEARAHVLSGTQYGELR
ncbi:MAG TPA: hypothetical protein VIE63_07045 [Ramlibacter sp.]